MPTLRLLDPAVRPLLDDDFLRGETETIDVRDFEREAAPELGRDVNLDPLTLVIDEAMAKFRSRPEESDGWLAPRVHATLRLTRREAALRDVWAYLNVAYRPDYVRWRFRSRKAPNEGLTSVERFLGEDSRNAIARLWWAGEMTRNGSDYALAAAVGGVSRFYISWLPLDVMHHRPAALAVARYLTGGFLGGPLPDVPSQKLAKAFNLCLSTVSVDAIAANPADDFEAVRDWCVESFDESKYLGDDLPEGPPEEAIDEDRIRPIFRLLDTLAGQIGLYDDALPANAPTVASAE